MEEIRLVKFAHEKANTHYKFVWTLEHNVSALKEWASLVGQDILESDDITFDTGILQKTKHSIKVYFITSRDKIIVKLRLGTPTLHGQFTHSKISGKALHICWPSGEMNSFAYITKGQLEEVSLKNILFDEPGMTETIWQFQYHPRYQGGGILSASTALKMQFTLKHIYWGDEAIQTKSMGNELALPNESTTWTTLNTKTLYHSNQLTDFVICCGDSNFKVHKIVLAIRSPVLAAMFEQPLTETLEGKMTISDYEPQHIEEFLKFLYTGNADFKNFASELFLLSDKYCVDHLKQLSEIHLINSVSVDNALDLYNLGKLAKSENLTKKCLDTIKRNKKEMFKTAGDAIVFLRDFPCAYEVIFE